MDIKKIGYENSIQYYTDILLINYIYVFTAKLENGILTITLPIQYYDKIQAIKDHFPCNVFFNYSQRAGII